MSDQLPEKQPFNALLDWIKELGNPYAVGLTAGIVATGIAWAIQSGLWVKPLIIMTSFSALTQVGRWMVLELSNESHNSLRILGLSIVGLTISLFALAAIGPGEPEPEAEPLVDRPATRTHTAEVSPENQPVDEPNADLGAATIEPNAVRPAQSHLHVASDALSPNREDLERRMPCHVHVHLLETVAKDPAAEVTVFREVSTFRIFYYVTNQCSDPREFGAALIRESPEQRLVTELPKIQLGPFASVSISALVEPLPNEGWTAKILVCGSTDNQCDEAPVTSVTWIGSPPSATEPKE